MKQILSGNESTTTARLTSDPTVAKSCGTTIFLWHIMQVKQHCDSRDLALLWMPSGMCITRIIMWCEIPSRQIECASESIFQRNETMFVCLREEFTTFTGLQNIMYHTSETFTNFGTHLQKRCIVWHRNILCPCLLPLHT